MLSIQYLTLKQVKSLKNFEKLKPFLKTGVPFFRVLILKMQHFHTKLRCCKPMLKQIEWGEQNRLIKKNGVLPTNYFVFFENLTWV